MLGLWNAVLSFVGGPVISGLLQAYQANLKAHTTDQQTAADLAGKEIALQQREIEVQNQLKIAEVGHPYEPEKLAFYVTLVFYSKCVIWDKVLHLGSTDALSGDVSTWAGMIMAFYFGKRTFENIARIIKK